MNHDYPTGLAIFSEIINMVRDEVSSEISVIIACPFIHLHSFAQLAKTYSNVYLAAQNCYQQEETLKDFKKIILDCFSTLPNHLIVSRTSDS